MTDYDILVALVALADQYGDGVRCEIEHDSLRIEPVVEKGRTVALTLRPAQWVVSVAFDRPGGVRFTYEARGSTGEAVVADATLSLSRFRKLVAGEAVDG